jgi:hypothetical protein
MDDELSLNDVINEIKANKQKQVDSQCEALKKGSFLDQILEVEDTNIQNKKTIETIIEFDINKTMSAQISHQPKFGYQQFLKLRENIKDSGNYDTEYERFVKKYEKHKSVSILKNHQFPTIKVWMIRLVKKIEKFKHQQLTPFCKKILENNAK